MSLYLRGIFQLFSISKHLGPHKMLSKRELPHTLSKNSGLPPGKKRPFCGNGPRAGYQRHSHRSVNSANALRCLCEREAKSTQRYKELIHIKIALWIPLGLSFLMTESLPQTAVQLRPQQGSRCAGACQATDLEVWPNQPQIITREEACRGLEGAQTWSRSFV